MQHITSRSRTTYDAIEPRPIRLIAELAVSSLESSIRFLRSYGVRVDGSTRLDKALDILRPAVKTGVLVPTHRGDSLGLRALELAHDMHAIAASLPNDRVADVRKELQIAIGGDLDPPASQRQALQHQSQFVVRAALIAGGTMPRHPTRSARRGKKPDLLLDNGAIEYGVEAKRPASARSVRARTRDASEQLAGYGVRGAILLDLADCLSSETALRPSDALSALVDDAYLEVSTPGIGYLPGREHVMVVGGYARVAWSSDDGPAEAHLKIGLVNRIGVFANSQGSLWDHHAQWIRQSFRTGLERLVDHLR